MLKANVLSSDTNKEIQSNINDFKYASGKTVVQKKSMNLLTSVKLTVQSGVKSINLSIKPNVIETESRTIRFNKSLELGYTPPRKTTLSK